MVVPGKCLVDSVCVFMCVFWKKCHEEKREEEKQQNTKQGLLLLPAAAAAAAAAALSIASKEVKENRTSRQRQHEARQRGRE